MLGRVDTHATPDKAEAKPAKAKKADKDEAPAEAAPEAETAGSLKQFATDRRDFPVEVKRRNWIDDPDAVQP